MSYIDEEEHENKNEDPEMDFNQFKHLQTLLAEMKIGQLVEGVDYEIVDYII